MFVWYVANLVEWNRCYCVCAIGGGGARGWGWGICDDEMRRCDGCDLRVVEGWNGVGVAGIGEFWVEGGL